MGQNKPTHHTQAALTQPIGANGSLRPQQPDERGNVARRTVVSASDSRSTSRAHVSTYRECDIRARLDVGSERFEELLDKSVA